MINQGKIITLIYGSLTISLMLFSGCMNMSEKETDSTAGTNGSFEIVKNGLPVNWMVYTPNTVANKADFTVEVDSIEFKEGRRSLKFDVRECVADGGRFSPGITNEFMEAGMYKGEATFRLSFCVKNQGSTFQIEAGGVRAMEGEMKRLVRSNEAMADWKYFEYEVPVKEGDHLRMQLNILEPGVFWIDDVRVVKI